MGLVFCDAVVWKQTNSQVSDRWEDMIDVGTEQGNGRVGKHFSLMMRFVFVLVLTNPSALFVVVVNYATCDFSPNYIFTFAVNIYLCK